MSVLRIGTSIKVGTGSGTLFWLDRWSGTRPFAERFFTLFSICSSPQLTVGMALADVGSIAFWPTFGVAEHAQWEELLECIALHTPSLEPDSLT